MKLDNILLANVGLQNEIRVIDFGCSIVHDDAIDQNSNSPSIPAMATIQSPLTPNRHTKFLKRRLEIASVLIGNQQGWAPEVWECANATVTHFTFCVIMRLTV